MALDVQISGEFASLVKALGLVGPDGNVNAEWFDHPLDYLRTILSNSSQRAALLDLLESALPSDAAPVAGENGRWHPLLEEGHLGQIYLTVDGDRIGFAGTVETASGTMPWARASIRLPLVDVSSGTLEAVAGTPQGPLQILLEARWAADAHPSGVAISASVDVDGGGSLRVFLENLDPTAAPGTRTEMDPAELGAGAARVAAYLVADGLRELSGGDPHVARVATCLPALLGLNGTVPPFPLGDVFHNPLAVREWLSQIAGNNGSLQEWFKAVAGLLGSGLPAASPVVSGDGSVAMPFRTPLVEFAAGSSLCLTLAAETPASGPPVLKVGLALELDAAAGRVEGAFTVFAVPLGGSSAVSVVPDAHIVVVAPKTGALIEQAPAVKVGTIVGGIAWDGIRLAPRLELHDVVLNGTPYQRLDLSSANAVVASATGVVQNAIAEALGNSRAAQAALALVGLRAPAVDAGWPHILDVAQLASNPTRAIAEVHRAALADPVHGWQSLFVELAAMFGITAPVAGSGTANDPWRVAIAGEGIATLELAAWNARTAGTPAGTELLRIGLRLAFAQAPWTGALSAELLAFDLPQGSTAALRFLGGLRASVALANIACPATPAGLALTADSIAAELAWSPGATPGWDVQIDNLVATGSGDSVGPVTVRFPMASFNTRATDLGLGIGAGQGMALLRLVLTEALHSWGGPAAITLGAMLGINRRLKGLPADWPLLAPPDPADLGSLFKDPIGAVRAQLERMAGGSSADGTPFVLAAIPWLRALLANELPDCPAETYPPDLGLEGAGRYDRPWVLPLAGRNLEILCWLDPDGPPRAWWQAAAERIGQCVDSAALVRELEAAAALIPELAGALDGRDRAQTASGLDDLAQWLACGDGFVPAAAQVPAGANWHQGTPVTAAHGDLPADPSAIAQIQQTIDAWAAGAPRAVVLLAPPFADQRTWSAYLQAAEPDRAVDAHFDMRGGGVSPADVTAVATHYTACLEGELAPMVVQLGRVVDRIKQLTGRDKVYLVGHSTAGVLARAYAAVFPESVAGLATLGTPHRGSLLSPLIDPAMADAVRLANVIYPRENRTTAGRAIAQLSAALDSPSSIESFAGLDQVTDTVPGFAIAGCVGTGLLEDLVDAAVARALAVSANLAPPTHFGFGARARLVLPDSDPGGLKIDADVRIDALEARLGATQAAATRAVPAIHVRADVNRTGGEWLVGGPQARPGERLRRIEFGLSMGNGRATNPWLRLYDAGLDAARPWLELEDLVERLPSLPRSVPLTREPPAAGTPPAFLLDLLKALGVVSADGSVSFEELGAIAAQPTARLGSRLPAVLAVVSGALPAEITISPNPWTLRLGTGPLQLAPAVSVEVGADLACPSFSGNVTASLELGSLRLSWTGADQKLTVEAPPWMKPVQLLPAPPAEVLRDALAGGIPMIAATSIVSGVLSSLAGGTRVEGLDRLLTSPGDWFVSLDLPALLRAAGNALGLSDSGGMRLPGGITLSAAASDPLTISLAGDLPLGDPADTLSLQLKMQIDSARNVTPCGNAILRLAMPGGGWATVQIEVGYDPTGLRLAVTPGTAGKIELLPSFSGFGALASGAASLLPSLLQAVVDRMAPNPQQATGLLRAVLDVAKAFGIYGFDTAGFNAPDRAAELGRMLSPGWLESKGSIAAGITDAIAAIFKDPNPLIDIPGAVAKTGSLVCWGDSLGAAGTVAAKIGWSGPLPALSVELLGARLGPVVIDEVRVGYDQGLVFGITLHLDPGGEIAFLDPALEFGFGNGALSFEFYPLGPNTASDVRVRLVPDQALEISQNGPVAILEQWALPLVARLLLREFDGKLGTEIWAGGPTVRAVLEKAGVLETGTTTLVANLPKPGALALRAVGALADDVTLWKNDSLALALRTDGGRHGIRLSGRQDIQGSIDASVRFGDADWLDDPDAGVTLWLLEDTSDTIPVRITPAVSLTGLGLMLSGAEGKALLEGSFEIGSVGAFLFANADFLDANRAFDLKISGLGAGAELQKARINVSSGDGDSFIAKILPKEMQAPFDLAVAWRDGKGLTLYGGSPGGALELTFPLNLDLTLIKIAELYLALRAKDGAASAEAALTGSASVGPIQASVQRVGLKLSFTSSGTKLGFRAPDGLGLSIDAGPVSGGGFLFIDEPKGQYAGGLQLKLQTLAITAIGLLNTKMPDGSPIPGGFSLLIIIAVEFPPIQIGFGFTLNGIGGLLGLNRTMDVQALRAGVRQRALDAMMFPPDPVANAPTVIRTLTAVFPVAPERFVIGPMVRLGWGSPPILTLDLAILLDLFTPLRIAILGRIKVALPQDDEVAVIKIHLDVIGIIDFERGEVSIDAELYDSVVAAFAITGGMALRARWKDQPAFALAVGGFHPAFQPPSDFPKLERIAISLATGDNPRLRLEAYFAVTSNTVQFGASLQLYAAACGFEIDGHLSFDALIQFDPFGLMVGISGSVAVRYEGETICGVSVDLNLTGPSPWHAWGSAKVEVLCFSAEVSFDARIGKAELPPPPPAVAVSGKLLDAVADAANWTAQPPSGEGVISLRSRPGSGEVLAHPLGGLTFSQRVVPLELSIECYGSAPVEGATRFEITAVSCGSVPVPAEDLADVRDDFAPAQFLSLTDDQKLSRPSFERFVSGASLHFDVYDVDDLAAGEAALFDYEVHVVDKADDSTGSSWLRLRDDIATGLAARASAAASAARLSGLRRFKAPAAAVRLHERRFTVVSRSDPSGKPLKTVQTFSQAVEFAGSGRKLTVVPAGKEPHDE